MQRDPTDLTLRTTLDVDGSWYDAHWYGDRPEPGPGLLRRAGGAIAAGMRRVATRVALPALQRTLRAAH